jgi:hypothetical protein
MSLGSYLTRIFNEPERAETVFDRAANSAMQGEKPKPKLAATRQAPSKESFDAWREHPVTMFVMAAHLEAAKESKERWIEGSWHSGIADQKALDENRVRADTYRELLDTDYTAYCETLGLEPRLED